jgi:hypothetical protein
MEYIGSITQASKNFTRDDWLDYIANDDCLVLGNAREVCNPANGQMVVFRPREDIVGLVVHDEEIGIFGWSENEDPLIVVSSMVGFENQVKAYALKIAQLIGGQFEDC